MMNRVASPLTQLAPHYTVVVVGSGYGGGVAASRLARAGQSVCVLERGREILPGEYPNDMASAAAEMQVATSRGTLGAPDGMFNLHLNDDMLALVGCGLGGTSLINANVALEIDARLFAAQSWPDEFRSDPELLGQYTERAMAMLDPSPYPADYPPLNKLLALEKSAAVMKQPFRRPPIAVNFVDQVNPFGIEQPRCNRCGDCTSGCNEGAKNTTLMNYLPDAHRHGAEIFTGARVSHVERDGTRWRVHFEAVPTRPAVPGAAPAVASSGSVSADVVVLAAGSLGSTEILLRSKERGLPMSDRLGRHFSGNGDVLAVGYDSYWKAAPGNATPPTYLNINGIGAGTNPEASGNLPGPCITGVIDMRGAPAVEDGLVIEEGVIPGALATLMPVALFFAQSQVGNFLQYGADQAKTRLLDAKEIGEAVQENPRGMTEMAYAGPTARTQTYLVMSVDEAAGRLVLDEDRLRIVWPGAGASPVIARDNQLLREASNAIQGQFIANPLWTHPVGQKLITVHPVGGCAMGNSAAEGVVNHQSQVFASNAGQDVHEGLYVCDGAVLPGAVGVNPLLTLTALAERACQRLADQRGWHIDLSLAARKPLPAGVPHGGAPEPAPAAPAAAPVHASLLQRLETTIAHTLTRVGAEFADEASGLFKNLLGHIESGAVDLATKVISDIIAKHPHVLSPKFQFTEGMHGWVSLEAVVPRPDVGQRMASDYTIATAWGRAKNQTMSFDLTIQTDDLYRLVSDATHPATITGSVTCAGLSPDPMPVISGTFHLLPTDTQRVETWTMNYEMVLQRGSGKLHFSGHKVLHQQAGSSWWTDTTTLFVQVHEGDSAEGAMVAQGILTLDLEDLLWQASTLEIDPPAGLLGDIERHVPRARNAITMAYLAKFGGFFGMLLFRAYGGMLANLNNFPATDLPGRPRRALRAQAPEVHQVPLTDGFSIRLTRYQGGGRGPVVLAPGFGVRASSFATDTVDENLVEALCARHYDVWLFDYRASADSGSPVAPYTIDDIARIDWPTATRFILERAGARDLQAIAHCVGSMSLMMAVLDGMSGIRSIISSQLTLHPVTGWLSYLKADLNMVGLLEGMTPEPGFDVVPGGTEIDHEVDAVAWNVPVPDGEQCTNPVCHRIFSIFGASYTHDQLNHWTHTALAEMFGAVALKPFEQLSLIMERGKVVDSQGNDSYVLPERAARLALPITFVAGAKNQLFFPETCVRTGEWLATHNDPHLYTRHVFNDYAHMDLFIGRNASRDVYPYLIEQLDRFNPAPV